MLNYRQLSEKLAEKREAMQALATQAATRSLTTDEATAFDALETEIRALVADCQRAQTAEANAAALAARSTPPASANTHNTGEARSLASYSLLNVVRATLPPSHEAYRSLSGVEKEMDQQAKLEARAHGQSLQGVGIPQMMLNRRDNTVTAGTQPDDGSAVVETNLRPVLDLNRPKSVLRELGATFLTGLVGNVGVPTLAAGAVSTWKSEIAALDKSNQTFSGAELTPHRLGTYAVRSKQFLLQTAPSIEDMLRRDLENSIQQALEIAAINGSGSSNQPLGILNTSGIGSVALGTNGGAFTRSTAIALAAAVMNANIQMTNPGYLMNVVTMAKLMDTKLDAGSGLFLMNEMDRLMGYKTAITTNVPSNLTKGSASGVASAVIFGNWSDLLVAQWGGLDITTDPYTLALNGEVRIIIQSFFDVLVQRPAAFAAVKDVLTA